MVDNIREVKKWNRKDYNANYYQNHKAERKLQNAEYNKNHKTEIKAKAVKSYQNHKNEINNKRNTKYRNIKVELIQVIGNKCQRDGCNIEYDGMNAPLFQFHHIDQKLNYLT